VEFAEMWLTRIGMEYMNMHVVRMYESKVIYGIPTSPKEI
jgi:hypothetical protein